MESHGQFSDFNTFDRQQNGIFQSQNGPQMPSQIPMNQIQYQQQMYQNSIYDPQNMYQEDPDIYQQQQQQMEGVGSNYSQYSQQDFLIQNQQNQFFPEESYEMPQYSQYDMQIPSQISYNSQIPSTSPNQFNQFQYPEQNIQQQIPQQQNMQQQMNYNSMVPQFSQNIQQILQNQTPEQQMLQQDIQRNMGLQTPIDNKTNKDFNVPHSIQIGKSTFQPPPQKERNKKYNHPNITISTNQQENKKNYTTIQSTTSGTKITAPKGIELKLNNTKDQHQNIQIKKNNIITSSPNNKPKEFTTTKTYKPGTNLETSDGVKLTVKGQTLAFNEKTSKISVNLKSNINKQIEVVKNSPKQTLVQDISINKSKKNIMIGNKTTDDKPIIIQRMREEDKDKIILDVLENNEPLSVYHKGKSYFMDKETNDYEHVNPSTQSNDNNPINKEHDQDVVDSMLDVYETITNKTEIVDIPVGHPEVAYPIKTTPLDLGKQDPHQKQNTNNDNLSHNQNIKSTNSHKHDDETNENEDPDQFLSDDNDIDPLTDMISVTNNIPDDMKDILSDVSECFKNDVDYKTGLPNDMIKEMIEAGEDEIFEEPTRVIKNYRLKVRKQRSKTPSPPPPEPILPESDIKEKQSPLSPTRSNPDLTSTDNEMISKNQQSSKQIKELTDKLLKSQQQTQEQMIQLQKQQQQIQEQMIQLQNAMQHKQPVEQIIEQFPDQIRQILSTFQQQQQHQTQTQTQQQSINIENFQQLLQQQQQVLIQQQQMQFSQFQEQQRQIQILQQQQQVQNSQVQITKPKRDIKIDTSLRAKELKIPEKRSITLTNKSNENTNKIIDSQTGFTVERRRDLNLLVTDLTSKPKDNTNNNDNNTQDHNNEKGITIGAEGITLPTGEKIAHKTKSFNFDPNEATHETQKGVAILANGQTTTPKMSNFDYKPVSAETSTFQPPRALSTFAKDSIFKNQQSQQDENVLKPPPEATGTIFQPPKDYKSKEETEQNKTEKEEKPAQQEEKHEEEDKQENEVQPSFILPTSQYQLHPDQFNQNITNTPDQYSYLLEQHGHVMPIISSQTNEGEEEEEKKEESINNSKETQHEENKEKEQSKRQNQTFNSKTNEITKLDGSDMKIETFVEPETFTFKENLSKQNETNEKSSHSTKNSNNQSVHLDVPSWDGFGNSVLGIDSSSGPENLIINETIPQKEEEEKKENIIYVSENGEILHDPSLINKQEKLRRRELKKRKNRNEFDEETKESSSEDGIYYRRDDSKSKTDKNLQNTASLIEDRKNRKKKKVNMTTVILVFGVCALLAVILGILSFYIYP